MLNPSMGELMNKVGNRYMLVNLAAKRARDIAQDCEKNGEILVEKSVKMALEEIADGMITLNEGSASARAAASAVSDTEFLKEGV